MPVRTGKLTRGLSLQDRDQAAGSRARGAAALAPEACPVGDGFPPLLVRGSVRGKEFGAQLAAGGGHQLLRENLVTISGGVGRSIPC